LWVGTKLTGGGAGRALSFLKAMPVARRFVLVSPLLGDLGELDLGGIDWAVVSTAQAPADDAALASFRLLCMGYGVSCWFEDADEAQRAVQRIVIACVTPLIVVLAPWFGVQPRSPVTDIAVTAYVGTIAILSFVYFFYLRHHPGKGVLAQYAFLLSDPIPAALFFFAEPEIFKWLAFLNAVIAARCGWRFGVRTFLLEWGLCFAVGLIVWFTAGLSQLLIPALQYFATLF